MRIRHSIPLTLLLSLSITSATWAQTTGNNNSASGGVGGASGTQGTMADAPNITGASIRGVDSTATSSNNSLDRSNFLAPTYGNPLYQGVYSNSTGTPGGFGQLTYGNTGGATGGALGTTGARTATTGAANTGRTATGFGTAGAGTGFGTQAGRTGGTGGIGNQGRLGGQQFGGFGAGGLGQGGLTGAQVVALPTNITYTASIRFTTPPITASQLQADLKAIVTRSSMLSNAAGIDVTMDGPMIVLRGNVKDEDEARLVEGMIRLSPGVRNVRNELVFPKQ